MKFESILEKGSGRLNEDNLLEWVQTGDAYIILMFHDNTYKVLVEQDDHDYETLCLWPAKKTGGIPGIEKAPADQIRKKRNFTPLVRLYQDLGLAGLKDRIRQIENLDPECCIYPRFKHHDDIAAIAITDLAFSSEASPL